jgi:hypothetical protein
MKFTTIISASVLLLALQLIHAAPVQVEVDERDIQWSDVEDFATREVPDDGGI